LVTRRAFWLASRATGISDDWYRNTKGVIVISFGIPWSARVNCWWTWEHLGVPMTSLGGPATSLGELRFTAEQSGKDKIFSGTVLVCL
jgi:hypothetical protein